MYWLNSTSSTVRSTRGQMRRGLSGAAGAASPLSAIGGAAAPVSSSKLISASRWLELGAQLRDARLQHPVGPLARAELARPFERNGVIDRALLGEHEASLGLVAPDQARQAGQPLALHGEVELVGEHRRALDLDLGAAGAEIAHDAVERRTPPIEGEQPAVIDAIP